MSTKPTLWALIAVLLLFGGLPAAAQEGVCDNAPPPRLTIGGWTVVTAAVAGTPAGGLRLRDTPRTTGGELAVLPAGTVARVLEGPACNDGFHWWRLFISQSEQEGWSAEGLGEVYYLAPSAAPVYTLTPTPVPIGATPVPPAAEASAECPGETAASYLRVGAAARVADQAHPVRLRAEPATDSLFLQVIYQDAILRVIGGPACVADRRWWQVDVNGRTGWTVEAAGGRYLLIDPANPPPVIVDPALLADIPPSPPDLPADVTPVPTPRPITPPPVIKRAAYTPDGARLVVGSGAGLRLYDAYTLALQQTIPVGPVIDLIVLEGGLYAVVWATDSLRVVDVTSGAIRTVLVQAPYDPAWAAASPDGAWLVLGPTSDGTPATLWDLNRAGPPEVVPYWWPGWGVIRAAFSPDNRYVVINDVINVRTCQVAGTGCQFDLVRNDFLPTGIFGAMTWSGDGAWAAGFSDRFWLWDGDALGVGFTLRSTLVGGDPRRVALSPDATRGAVAINRLMEVWNLEVGNYYVERVVELPGAVGSLAFRPDGAHLAVAAGDRVVIYDPATAAAIQQIE
ncbi:MAG: WD40 repeat domain-containing protein [Anaerolineae bacterium]|nr:WD40 repeat domain-containing protein [Anaerolineae bacterium]